MAADEDVDEMERSLHRATELLEQLGAEVAQRTDDLREVGAIRDGLLRSTREPLVALTGDMVIRAATAAAVRRFGRPDCVGQALGVVVEPELVRAIRAVAAEEGHDGAPCRIAAAEGTALVHRAGDVIVVAFDAGDAGTGGPSADPPG